MKFLILAALVIISACTGAGGSSNAVLNNANKGKDVVKINDETIREGYLNMLSEINPRIKSQLTNPASRKQFLDNLVEQELIYQESIKRGVDKKPEVAQKYALYQKIIISQALLDEELDKKSKDYYEQKKNEEFTKVKIAQIQVDFIPPAADDKEIKKDDDTKEATPEQKQKALDKTKALIARLKAGEDFAKIATESSDDKLTSKKAGDFGAISKDDKRLARRGLETLGDAAFKLKKDEISDIIESKRAYHIIKVTSEPELTPFEEASKVLRFQLQKDVKDGLMADLKKSAKINFAEVNDAKPAIVSPAPAVVPGDPNQPPPAEPVAEPVVQPGTPPAIPPAQFALPPGNKIEFKPVLKTETAPK